MSILNSNQTHPRARSLAAAALLGGLALALVAGCTIEDPALPTFSTRLAVPVGSHDLTATELIEDQDYLYAGGDSLLFFSIDGDTTSVDLDLDLSTDLEAIDAEASIGTVTLDDPDPLVYEFTLEDIWPGAGALPPGYYPVPPFDVDTETDPLELADLDHAHVASGVITLALDNRLPIPISGDAPPRMITAEVRHPDTGALITSLVFDAEIAAGEADTASADLTDVDLPGSLVVHLTGGSAGATFAYIGPDAALGVALSMGDLVVDSARAIVGAQDFQETSSIALPDSLRIIEAVVDGGAIDVTLSSGLPVPATVYIYFNEFLTPEGGPYVLTFAMPQHGVESTQADLAAARITSGGGAPLDSLSYTVGVYSPGSDGEMVDIHSGMRISAEMAASTLSIGEVTGIIPRQDFALETVTEAIDIPDELSGLRLPAATLVIELVNETGIGGEIDLSLTGRNAAGESVTVATSSTVAPAQGGEPAKTTVVLDETNSLIADLLSILPEEFTLEGAVSVGGEDEVGTVRPGDRAQVIWRADAPLRLIIDDAEIDREPELLDLDEDLRDNLDRHLVAAEIVLEINNHFPFGLDVEFLVGPDEATLLDDPELVIGPVTVAPGDIDPVTRYVRDIVKTQQTITLDATQIAAFTRPGACTALRALIPGTEGLEVVLRTCDGLSARGALSAEILVTDD